MIASFFILDVTFFKSIRLIRKEYKLITLHMRTRMMALFALIAFCVMPIEAKKVKGNGDIITKEISVRDYSAIKVGSTAMGYSDSWFSLFSRGGNPSYVFGYTQGESASLRITIDENLYPYINVQVKMKNFQSPQRMVHN